MPPAVEPAPRHPGPAGAAHAADRVQHGWGIAQRIQQVSEDVLRVDQGSLYPSLHRLEHEGWIEAEWGELRQQPAGEVLPPHARRPKRLADETASWERLAGAVTRVLQARTEAPCCRSLRHWLRALFARDRVERELDDELRHHLELEAERATAARHARRGAPPGRARAVRRRRGA